MKLHRSLLFVPGIRENMLEKAAGSDADIVVLDLEDSVPPAEKARARELVGQHAPRIAAAGRQVHVRVNPGPEAREDISAVLSASVGGVSLPKVEGPQDVRDFDVLLREFELEREIRPGATALILWVESAQGLLRLGESLVASTRVAGAALGPEDYCNDLEIRHTPGGEELDFARNTVAVAAIGAGVIPLDGPYSDFRNDDGLRAESERVRQMGFKGRFCIHPAQIPIVNEAFSPAPEEVELARRIVEAYDAGVRDGRGAIQLEGRMIDVPVARRARRLLAAAAALEERAGPPRKESDS
ncbi:MAG: CoA ester lyase [Dehalococcoidia bacterium]